MHRGGNYEGLIPGRGAIRQLMVAKGGGVIFFSGV